MTKSLNEIVKNPMKNSIVFNNEFHRECYEQRKHSQDLEEWTLRFVASIILYKLIIHIHNSCL